MNYEKLLEGKKALITAGADGIGYAIAKRFEKAGAKVFVCDINEDAVNRANSVDDNIKAMVCDLRQTQLIASMVEAGFDYLKELDIIVNNAGIAGETAGVGELTLGGWQECLQVNMTSHFETMRIAVPRMNNEGSILSVSSVAGRVGFAYRLPYAATKWAVIGMVKSLAIELGPRGIRANALLPGIVEGERQNRVIEAKAKVKKTPALIYSERSNVKPFTEADPQLYGSPKGRAQGRAIWDVERARKGETITEAVHAHHLVTKGGTAAAFKKMEEFVAQGKAHMDDVVTMFEYAEMKGVKPGDVRSNNAWIQDTPHNQLHQEVLIPAGDEFKQAQWEKILKEQDTPAKLMDWWVDQVDNNYVPNKATGQIWQDLDDLINRVKASN